jgi:hypothetical protein
MNCLRSRDRLNYIYYSLIHIFYKVIQQTNANLILSTSIVDLKKNLRLSRTTPIDIPI